MLSLNIFPLARIQIGILIKRHLNFEHCRKRHKASLGSLGNVMLFLTELPPARAQLELNLQQVKQKKSRLFPKLMRPYRADVPDPVCGVGLDCRKSPVLRIRSRGPPLGGSHTGAGRGPKTPPESRAPASTAWTPPIAWP